MVTVWVKIFNLPKVLWYDKGLGFVAILIGKPIQMDEITTSSKRLEFTCVCVYIKANQAFPSKVSMGIDRIVALEFEYQSRP